MPQVEFLKNIVDVLVVTQMWLVEDRHSTRSALGKMVDCFFYRFTSPRHGKGC